MMPENVQKEFRIYIRKRAFNAKDIHIPGLLEKKSTTSIVLTTDHDESRYVFDHIFGSDTTQFEIYDIAIRPLLQHTYTGYNSVIFGYGASGSGKTYTLIGEQPKKVASFEATTLGMLPRVLHQLFEYIEDQNLDQQVLVSFGEVYRNKLQDLMVVGGETSWGDAADKEVENLEDLTECVVSNMLEFDELLGLANVDQDTSNCTRNKSEVYTIYSIIIRDKYNQKSVIGTMTILDLADSQNLGDIPQAYFLEERLSPSGQSLLSIIRLIHAWARDDDKLPFEDSKVTSLLQKKMDKKTKVALIATISPSADTIDETKDTLDYADQAHLARNHFGRIEKPLQELISIERDIELLREDLIELVEREEFARTGTISTNIRRPTQLHNFFDNCQMLEEDCLFAMEGYDTLFENMRNLEMSETSENYVRQAREFLDKKDQVSVILTEVNRWRDTAFNLLFNCPQKDTLTLRSRRLYSNYYRSARGMPMFVKELWFPGMLSSPENSDNYVENTMDITRLLRQQENEIPQLPASAVDDETSEKDNPQPTATSTQPDDEGVNVVVHDASTEGEGKQQKVEEHDVIQVMFDVRQRDEPRSLLDMAQAEDNSSTDSDGFTKIFVRPSFRKRKRARFVNLVDVSTSSSEDIGEGVASVPSFLVAAPSSRMREVIQVEDRSTTNSDDSFDKVIVGSLLKLTELEDRSLERTAKKTSKDDDADDERSQDNLSQQGLELYEASPLLQKHPEEVARLAGTSSNEGGESIHEEKVGVEGPAIRVQDVQGRYTSWELQDSWSESEGTSTSDSDKGSGKFVPKSFLSQERTAEEIAKDDAADQSGTVQNVEEHSEENLAEPGLKLDEPSALLQKQPEEAARLADESIPEDEVSVELPGIRVQDVQGRYTSWELQDSWSEPEGTSTNDSDKGSGKFVVKFFPSQERTAEEIAKDYAADQSGTVQNVDEHSEEHLAEPGLKLYKPSAFLQKQTEQAARLAGECIRDYEVSVELPGIRVQDVQGRYTSWELQDSWSEPEGTSTNDSDKGSGKFIVKSFPSQERTAEEIAKDYAADQSETVQNVEEHSEKQLAEPGLKLYEPSALLQKQTEEAARLAGESKREDEVSVELPGIRVQDVQGRYTSWELQDSWSEPEGTSTSDSDKGSGKFVVKSFPSQERTAEEIAKDYAADQSETVQNVEEHSEEHLAEPGLKLYEPFALLQKQTEQAARLAGESIREDEVSVELPGIRVQDVKGRYTSWELQDSWSEPEGTSTSDSDKGSGKFVVKFFPSQERTAEEIAKDYAADQSGTVQNVDEHSKEHLAEPGLKLYEPFALLQKQPEEAAGLAGDSIREDEVGVELPGIRVQEVQDRHISWELQDSWSEPEGTSTSDSDKGSGKFVPKCFPSQERTAEEIAKDGAADQPKTVQNVGECSQQDSADGSDDIVHIFSRPRFRNRKLERKPVTFEDRPPTDVVGQFFGAQKTEKRLDLSQQDRSAQAEDKRSTGSDKNNITVVCPSTGMRKRALELVSTGKGSTRDSDDISEGVLSVLSFIEVQESKKCYDLRQQEPESVAVDSGDLEEVVATPSVMLTKLEGEPIKPEDKSPARSGDSGEQVAVTESIEPEGADEMRRHVPEDVSEVQQLDTSQKYKDASTQTYPRKVLKMKLHK